MAPQQPSSPSSQNDGRAPLAVIVMAAGLGTRMKSDIPKVLHHVCGRPILSYVIDAALELDPERLVVVTGPDDDAVDAVLPPGAERAVQAERRGSGDAVRAGMVPLAGFPGEVLVLSGDVPLAGPDLYAQLLDQRHETDARAAISTVVLADPAHYGRILRDEGGMVARIVEARDATPEELDVLEINVGFYVFAADDLRRFLPQLRPDNAQGEYYVTDLVRLVIGDGGRVAAAVADDQAACMGINTRVELAEANAAMRRRLVDRLMLAGVTVEDPASTYVDHGVVVGRDTVIKPQTTLTGLTAVGARCVIGPASSLRDVVVGDETSIVSSHLIECIVADRCSVGPFAYIRPGTELADGAKAGTFVEIKASRVGRGSKVPHLSYVGDAVIGENSNIAAGNITANYDGERKHPTVIGDNVKTGSDTVFVAPVTLGDDAWTAAGSVITRDIPDGALGVARARQENVDRYSERRRLRGASDS
jgi:bifunctional UDP-N-acetylglucosamine pyrophosphorylase / glucosamine-1-phosphate N-acetyltransferase